MTLTLKYRDQIKIPMNTHCLGQAHCDVITGLQVAAILSWAQNVASQCGPEEERVLIRSPSIQKGERKGGKRKEIAES